MRMVNTDYDITINFKENQVNVLCIENPDCFASVISDLWSQNRGGEGAWILSDEDKALSLVKGIELIINPFSVDCNDRRILKVLYQDIETVLRDEYYDQYALVNANMASLISRVMDEQPYPLDINAEISLADLFKLYNLHFDTEYTSLCERLDSYIKIWHRVGRVEIYVFVNLKAYLNEEQYVELCRQAFYEKINIILIEDHYADQGRKDFENVKIIDCDLCCIEL